MKIKLEELQAQKEPIIHVQDYIINPFFSFTADGMKSIKLKDYPDYILDNLNSLTNRAENLQEIL